MRDCKFAPRLYHSKLKCDRPAGLKGMCRNKVHSELISTTRTKKTNNNHIENNWNSNMYVVDITWERLRVFHLKLKDLIWTSFLMAEPRHDYGKESPSTDAVRNCWSGCCLIVGELFWRFLWFEVRTCERTPSHCELDLIKITKKQFPSRITEKIHMHCLAWYRSNDSFNSIQFNWFKFVVDGYFCIEMCFYLSIVCTSYYVSGK